MNARDDLWWSNLVRCCRTDMPHRKIEGGISWGQCEEHGKECTQKNCTQYQEVMKIKLRFSRKMNPNAMNIRYG